MPAKDATSDAEQAIQRIRELNERVIDLGREAGASFLEAYEQTLRSFADFQEKAAEATQVDWIASMARAQANFTRDVLATYTKALRGDVPK